MGKKFFVNTVLGFAFTGVTLAAFQNCGGFAPQLLNQNLAVGSSDSPITPNLGDSGILPEQTMMLPSNVSAPSVNALQNTPGKVIPVAAQTIRGWGMSLAWEANDLYGSSLQNSLVPDPAQQSLYMDLLYGDPTKMTSLGLNVVRYNIGGGENPTHTHMRKDAQMEGYLDGPGQSYNWSRDASQRKMMQEAKKRGANIFEAFSNSPPYWMTNSGCASGANGGGQDNLPSNNYQAFVDYLVTVTQHLQATEGITFESLEAFNEPDGYWWVFGNSQEGLFAAASTQNAVLPMLSASIKKAGLSAFISGTDANNLDNMTSYLNQFSTDALSTLGRVNVHQYNGSNLNGLLNLVHGLGKPIWQSEVGCCLTDQSEMGGAMYMSDRIRTSLRDMGTEVWNLWQPDWNVIDFNGGKPKPMKQFYAMAHSTNFIRQGFKVISSGSDDTLAAYDSKSKRLVLVRTSYAGGAEDFDLTAFANLPNEASTYQTTSNADINLRAARVMLTTQGHLSVDVPANSITTFVIDGVTVK